MNPTTDDRLMKRAITLSLKGAGMAYPNPMVGAVMVKDGRIIGEGWHRGAGQPHAEVEAIKACRVNPAGATLYVTLEPCNHYGRTPPCTEAIINAGIAEVKIGITDPNPRVRGGGAKRLRGAGIKVEEGLCKAEILKINRDFIYYSLTGYPWVMMKAAMSLDGKIACVGGESQWITSFKSRKFVHRLRARVGAVLIGSGTQQKDNPQLTNRLAEPGNRQPLKVLFDSTLKISLESNLIRQDPSQLIIFCTERADQAKESDLQKLGVKVIRQNSITEVNPSTALKTLGTMGVQSVLVEGGHRIFTSFIEENLVNEFYLFYAPFFIGGETATGVLGGKGLSSLPEASRLLVQSVKKIGGDLLVHAYKEGSDPACLRV